MAKIPIGRGVLAASSTVFIPVCTFVVCLRFYTRRVQQMPFKIDDWLTIPALILVIGMQITMIVEFSRRAIGYRIPNAVPGEPDARANQVLWPFELEEIPALGLTKLSFVFFFRRVFNTRITRWYDILTSGMIIITIAWTITFFFAFLFICGSKPRSFWASPKLELADCVRTQKLHNGFVVSDVILDVIIISMSIPIVWSLNISATKKWGVAGMFLFGAIALGASITRAAVFLQDVAERYNPNLDYELLVTSGVYWSMLEAGMGLIAANLVVLYGLVVGRTRKSLPRLTRGTFRLHSTNRSDTERGPRHSDERKMWDGSSGPVTSFAEFRPESSTNEDAVELNDILVTRTLHSTGDNL